MFTRRVDFVMRMDVELEHAFEELGVRSVVGGVERAASEALLEHGQEATSFTADLRGVWTSIGVAFKGDTAGASAAFDAWCDRIMRVRNSGRVRTASLTGSDGTHRAYIDARVRQGLEASLPLRA